jgi:hypothetical protein
LKQEILKEVMVKLMNQCSSASIVSIYWMTGLTSDTVTVFFLQPHVQQVLRLFPWGKAQVWHDTDHLPPSGAEVKDTWEPYLLSSQVPPWCVAGQLLKIKLSLSPNHRNEWSGGIAPFALILITTCR